MRSNILIFAGLVFLGSCISKETIDFKLTGRLKNLDGSILTLKYEDKTYDKDTVKNGAFLLQGKFPDLEFCKVTIYGTKPKGSKSPNEWIYGRYFFVKKGASYTWLADGYDDFFQKNDSIATTSTSQREFDHLEKLKNDHWKLIKEKKEELERKRYYYLEKGDMVSYKTLTDSVSLMETNPPTIGNVINKFLDENPNTYVSIYTLATSRSLKKNLDFYSTVYERLKPEFKNHRYAIEYKEKADQMQKILKNEKFKVDIYAKDKTGKLFNLDDYKAYQMIFIDIWASWCVPCIEQMPAAARMQKELLKHGVAYVYLSIDDSSTSKAWLKLNSSLKLEQSYLLDSSANKQFQNQMVVETVPRYFIINNKGELLAKEAPGPGDPEKLMAVIGGLK